MDKQTSSAVVECLVRYSLQDIEVIQNLLAQLSDHFKSHTTSKSLIDEIITSPYHDILVARDTSNDTIIGCATLSVTFGVGAGCKAWLDDFVVDHKLHDKGIGSLLWNEVLAWAQRHNATSLQFTSSDKHKAAHGFYLKRGAVIRQTHFFRKSIS